MEALPGGKETRLMPLLFPRTCRGCGREFPVSLKEILEGLEWCSKECYHSDPKIKSAKRTLDSIFEKRQEEERYGKRR